MDEDQLREAFHNVKNMERLEVDQNTGKTIEAYSVFIHNCSQYIHKAANDGKTNTEMTVLLAQAYNNRGFLKYLQVDFDEAIEDYSKGLRYDPTMHYSYYNRGLIHYRLARFSEAILDMERSLQLKPYFEPAQKCLQQSLIDRDRKTHTVTLSSPD